MVRPLPLEPLCEHIINPRARPETIIKPASTKAGTNFLQLVYHNRYNSSSTTAKDNHCGNNFANIE